MEIDENNCRFCLISNAECFDLFDDRKSRESSDEGSNTIKVAAVKLGRAFFISVPAEFTKAESTQLISPHDVPVWLTGLDCSMSPSLRLSD